MSTQHPDNASVPFFSDSPVIQGETEITEAYYAFSHLGCHEQLWDCEGKESDSYVVKKLLSSDEAFFQENVLGKDFFLTLRIPNPAVEKNEAKVLIETLESIPRSFDVSRQFYGNGTAPIFEVVLPMTASAEQLNNIYCYYRDFVAGKQSHKLNNTTIGEWVGSFEPKTISVIPLFETRDQILGSDSIVSAYLSDKRAEFQRVWFARSDPALNYGSLAAVLYNKIALQRIDKLEKKLSVKLLPIIGLGSCPFRGNFKPTDVSNCLSGYPSVQTFTAQSAFKYDYPVGVVKDAFDVINSTKPGNPFVVDEDVSLALADKCSAQYEKEIKLAAPAVNQLSAYIPSRRKRKLHIGLFGYSRKAGSVSLPRAITFCAALYSVGFPPELLGLSALSEQELDVIRKNYCNFDADIAEAAKYYNPDCSSILPKEIIKNANLSLSRIRCEPHPEHRMATSKIINLLGSGSFSEIQPLVVQAARLRSFLG